MITQYQNDEVKKCQMILIKITVDITDLFLLDDTTTITNFLWVIGQAKAKLDKISNFY